MQIDDQPSKATWWLLRSTLLVFMIYVVSAMALAQDPGWPRQITKPGGKLVLYQPQVDDWKNYQLVEGRMAFTLTPTAGQSYVGVVTVQLKSVVNMDDHTVLLSDPVVTSVSFPSLDAATTSRMDQLMKTFLNPSATMTISLERLVASVKKAQAPPAAAVKNDPPEIFISLRPAILLQANGTAVTAPIAGSTLQFIVNVNWPLFVESSSSNYYLFDGKGWLTAKAVQGPWTSTSTLPKEMSKVPANPNFTDLKAFIPPPPGSSVGTPMVYYSATPAELVVFGGRPRMDCDYRHTVVLRVQHRQPSLQVHAHRRFLLLNFRTVVYVGHSSARTLDLRNV